MASTKDEITAIAVEHGYTGRKPDSIAKAIDALADTLAGTDVKSGRSIAGAIHALAPHIGSGSGGAALGAMQYWPMYSIAANAPAIGGSTSNLEVRSMPGVVLSVGSSVVCEDASFEGFEGSIPMIASGVGVTWKLLNYAGSQVSGEYRATYVVGATQERTIASVREIDATYADDTLSFIMPELESGEVVVAWFYKGAS